MLESSWTKRSWEDEINAVTKVLNSTTQMGKNVRFFEKKIAKLFSKNKGLW